MVTEHQKLVTPRIAGADGGTCLLHKITKKTKAWRGGVQILKEEEEDVKP